MDEVQEPGCLFSGRSLPPRGRVLFLEQELHSVVDAAQLAVIDNSCAGSQVSEGLDIFSSDKDARLGLPGNDVVLAPARERCQAKGDGGRHVLEKAGQELDRIAASPVDVCARMAAGEICYLDQERDEIFTDRLKRDVQADVRAPSSCAAYDEDAVFFRVEVDQGPA